MRNSKFIITQGGVSLYEAISTGNQVFCIPNNNLQKKIIRNLKLFAEFKVIKNFKNLNFKSYNNIENVHQIILLSLVDLIFKKSEY